MGSLATPESVSYTHLDVYKRQTYLPCINGKYGVKINFNFKNSHQYFIVKCSDRPDTIIKYADLPLIINNLERVRPYQISIYDSLNTSCALPVSYTHLDVYKRQLQG